MGDQVLAKQTLIYTIVILFPSQSVYSSVVWLVCILWICFSPVASIAATQDGSYNAETCLLSSFIVTHSNAS